MASAGNKSRPHFHQPAFCTRTQQVAALALVATTFFLTRFIDQTFFAPCSSSSGFSPPIGRAAVSNVAVSGSSVSWPERGFGSRLDLKIYVYGEDEIDGLKSLLYGRDGKITADGCAKGQWGTQVKIHRLLLASRFRTMNKEDADLFFVPAYVKCVRMKGGLTDKEINQAYIKVLSQMKYFRLSGGRDHVFVFPSGAGAHLFKSWATYINRSVILTPEGDRTDKRDTSAFNTWKDIIIPGNVEDGMTGEATLVQPLPLSKRKHLANYLGRAQGKAGRLKLIELAKQYPNKLECPELKFSGPDKLGRKDYFEHLRNAKFCLAPRGESSWTLRFYEAYFVECVPVLLSDQAELPFQDVIDYTQISIKLPSSWIGFHQAVLGRRSRRSRLGREGQEGSRERVGREGGRRSRLGRRSYCGTLLGRWLQMEALEVDDEYRVLRWRHGEDDVRLGFEERWGNEIPGLSGGNKIRE